MTVERCTICPLPDGKRAEVEAAYKAASGSADADAAVLDVASRYRISRLALRRHDEHIGPRGAAPSKARDVLLHPKTPAPSKPPRALLPPREGSSRTTSTSAAEPGPESPALGDGTVVERARVLLAYLAVPDRTPQQLAQAREIRAALTLEARLVGAMTTKAKLHEHPDWSAFVEELVTALARVPGALDALEAFLARAEERRAAA